MASSPSPCSPTSEKAVLQCLDIAADAQTFMTMFAPDRQCDYCRSGEERIFLGKAPTLCTVEKAYGRQTVESWTELQLRDLSEYAGSRNKLTSRQTDEMSKLIQLHYSHLKVTEMMYFFHLFKMGCFGKFYGTIDTLSIMEALRKFMGTRNTILGRIYERQEERRREREAREQAARCITYEEYLRRKALREQAAAAAHGNSNDGNGPSAGSPTSGGSPSSSASRDGDDDAAAVVVEA